MLLAWVYQADMRKYFRNIALISARKTNRFFRFAYCKTKKWFFTLRLRHNEKGRFRVLFVMAEAEGFEPPWAVDPNGFQDRLVVTASIRLLVLAGVYYSSFRAPLSTDYRLRR